VAPEIRAVGIVGAGTMGAGIAQVALEAGHDVRITDRDPSARASTLERVRGGLSRRAAKTGETDLWVALTSGRLDLESSPEAVASGADLVIEAAIEDLSVKQALFRSLAAAAPAHAILATNTSALSVTAIAAATPCPERVIGLHFFNPAPVMRLVEVVATSASDPVVVDVATALMAAWGKTPVRCADSPGFIVNRVNRPFTIEALRILESGAADVEAIDAAMQTAGFPMGPFELMDLIGIDVNLAAAQGVWEGLGRPDRLRPSSIQERLVATGHLGRKSGEGFYRYDGSGHGLGPATGLSLASSPPAAPLSAGSIAARIVEAIESEAGIAEREGVASAADIRLALELGAGHPAHRVGTAGRESLT
jgi:3-hydroxybutyryl-CoA dehydrogenase